MITPAKKVQIEHIKHGGFMARLVNDQILLTDGNIVVFAYKQECNLDLTKMKEMPEKAAKLLIEKDLTQYGKPVELSRKALIIGKSTIRLFLTQEGEEIYVKESYLKLFPATKYDYRSVEIETECGPTLAILCVKGEQCRGLIFPVKVY